ncbi:MAG: hypothetical protein ACRC3H_07260 [Lachnospiraceae bacterium]
MNKLDPNAVNKLFDDCCQDDKSALKCEGIMSIAYFDKSKLEANEVEIYAMLNELPIEFFRDSGGGYSFLAACNDKYGNQWTGLHSVMEKLFLLGMGIGKVQCLLPKEVWTALPGGMPYYVIY